MGVRVSVNTAGGIQNSQRKEMGLQRRPLTLQPLGRLQAIWIEDKVHMTKNPAPKWAKDDKTPRALESVERDLRLVGNQCPSISGVKSKSDDGSM
jgi:hypothetical protein